MSERIGSDIQAKRKGECEGETGRCCIHIAAINIDRQQRFGAGDSAKFMEQRCLADAARPRNMKNDKRPSP